MSDPISADNIAAIRKQLAYRIEIGSQPVDDEDLVAVLSAYDSQARRIEELESLDDRAKILQRLLGAAQTRIAELERKNVPRELVARLFAAVCFAHPEWVLSRGDVCDPIRNALSNLPQPDAS